MLCDYNYESKKAYIFLILVWKYSVLTINSDANCRLWPCIKRWGSFLLLTAEFLWMNVEIIQKLSLYIFEKTKYKLMHVSRRMTEQ